MKKIAYAKNVYGKEEIQAVINTLKKNTQMSANVEKFERKISNKFSGKYGLMVNSASSAIILGLKVLNLKLNDEVIVPCLNFGTAISSLTFLGLRPIFVDIKIDSLQIDEDLIEKKITKKTKALMIPNLIGNIPNWAKINRIAKKHNLKIIEDSADTIGAKFNGKSTGFYSDISVTSFYGSHVISCAGNGGMLILKNKKDYNNAKILRSWGRLSSTLKYSENIKDRLSVTLKGYDYDKKFVFEKPGFNFEPSEIGAAFGLQQFKKLNKFSKIRNLNFKYHQTFFLGLNKYFISPKVYKNVYTNFLAYPLIIKKESGIKRKNLQIFLEKNNIQTRPIFSGNILRHPAFTNLISKKNKLNNFPNSDYIMKYGILIGCHQGLKIQDLRFVHKMVLKFLKS